MSHIRLLFSTVFALTLFATPLQAQFLLQRGCGPQVDYVIVGVGTAGAVLAKKLSDDKVTSVVALHNGPNLINDPEIKFSANALSTVLSALIGPPLYEQGFTVPQVNADNREILWVIALPGGGASSVNAGAYCRATPQLLSQWEALAGPEWSPNVLLQVYKDLETYTGQTPDPAARGEQGPISVLQDPNPSQVSQTFTQAIINATGFPFVLDYNDPNTTIGASSQLQYTQSGPNGELRVSSETAFLNDTVMNRNGRGVNGRKLRVLFDSPALRTLWKGNKAVGVEYLSNGERKQILARKGVIVTAGLRSSPFLMHSGVGPKALLESLNIPVKFDNPNVGQGLADQQNMVIIFSSNPDDTPAQQQGIFSQIAHLPAPGGDPTSRQIRFSTINPIPGVTAALVDLLQPLSRGTIVINSADPLDPPVVDDGVFSNPSDLALYQQTFQTYIKNINLALQAIDPLYTLINPDPAILDDINLLTDFLLERVGSNQHFQSHCRMAPIDNGGVVDNRGRVYGVQNLYVADDSVVPQDMDGSPMSSAYLIAANIARLILSQ